MSPLDETTKQRSGIAVLAVCFVAVAVALVLLGVGVIGPGWAVILSIVVILVTSGIAALLNAMKQTVDTGRTSTRQRTAILLVAGLFAISIGAMLVLVTLTDPLELIKSALSGVIVLAGTAVAAVLAMLRADAARDSAEQARAESEGARAESAQAKSEAQAAKAAAGGERR